LSPRRLERGNSLAVIAEEPFELVNEREPWRRVRGVVVRPPEGEDAAVLCLHGFKGFMNWGFFPELRRRLVREGLGVVAFDTSCNGVGEDLETMSEEDHFARNTWSRELEDVALVRAHVDGLARRWGLLGHSRGGGSALLHAAGDGTYRAIVTWAAVAHTARYTPEIAASWREEGHVPVVNARTGQTLRLDVEVLDDMEQNREQLDILGACARLHVPTLLVHGSADETVPVEECHQLQEAFPDGVARSLVIDGSGHTFEAAHPFTGVTEALERVYDGTCAHFVAALR